MTAYYIIHKNKMCLGLCPCQTIYSSWYYVCTFYPPPPPGDPNSPNRVTFFHEKRRPVENIKIAQGKITPIYLPGRSTWVFLFLKFSPYRSQRNNSLLFTVRFFYVPKKEKKNYKFTVVTTRENRQHVNIRHVRKLYPESFFVFP